MFHDPALGWKFRRVPRLKVSFALQNSAELFTTLHLISNPVVLLQPFNGLQPRVCSTTHQLITQHFRVFRHPRVRWKTSLNTQCFSELCSSQWYIHGTPTKRQVSKCLVSKRPVSKRQVYKTSGLQNVRLQNVCFQNVLFLNFIYLWNKKYLYLSFLLITSHYGDIWQKTSKIENKPQPSPCLQTWLQHNLRISTNHKYRIFMDGIL